MKFRALYTCMIVMYVLPDFAIRQRKLFQSILVWKHVKGSQAYREDPDQTPHNVTSDQDLHCSLTRFFYQI